MLTQFVVFSAVTYTLVRFVVIDAIFDRPRDAVHGWLLGRRNTLALLIHELLSCAGCVAFWGSLFTVLVADFNPWWPQSIPMPAVLVLACRTGALVFAVIIDPADDEDEDE
jgi:hypothetical protein